MSSWAPSTGATIGPTADNVMKSENSRAAASVTSAVSLSWKVAPAPCSGAPKASSASSGAMTCSTRLGPASTTVTEWAVPCVS